MSTIVTLPNASVVESGQWADVGSFAGHDSFRGRGRDSRLDFDVVIPEGGSDISMTILQEDVGAKVYIDDVLVHNIAGNWPTWTSYTVASGVAAGTHRITLRMGATTGIWIDKAVGFTFSADGVTVSTPSTNALLDPASFGPQYICTDAANASYIKQEGGPDTDGAWTPTAELAYSSPLILKATWPSQAIRFKDACTAVYAWVYRNGTKVRLRVDDTDDETVTLPSDLRADWTLIKSGLNASQQHTFTLTFASNTTDPQYIYAIMLAGSDTSLRATLSARRGLAVYGDSIARSVGFYTDNDTTNGYGYLVAKGLGLQYYNRGVTSSTLKNISGGSGPETTSAGETRTADITDNTNLDVVLEGYGTNDATRIDGATETLVEFRAAADAMWAALDDLTPTTKYLSMGLTRRTDAVNTTDLDTEKAAAVAALSNASVRYTQTRTWTVDGDNADAVHIGTAGHAKIANRLVPLVAAAGFAVSLSSPSGAVDSPVTITFTRAGGSTWLTGETVTVDDDSDGTFGSFTFTPGETTGTMTYTPASAGTKTLNFTNGQGWTNPDDVEYVATANDTAMFPVVAPITGTGSLYAITSPVASPVAG